MIRKGEVVAIPTDTFYGLAANPFDAEAVERVFAIKGRAKHMPLLLLVDSAAMARELAANLPEKFERLAKRFWPGPLTMVVEAGARVPAAVTGGTGRIGLRVPQAAVAAAIVKQAGGPIIGTSANRSGEKECATAEEVEEQIGAAVPLILDGGDGGDGGASGAVRASTVVDVRADSWKVLREGAIEARAIARVLGEPGEPGKPGEPGEPA
jgi:tRNA threonylcarbamoyl adenosine modification protein (Sua5/YciO/YrdC/YwlC family)